MIYQVYSICLFTEKWLNNFKILEILFIKRPDCTPMCPDKACEMTDCPKCVNVCKAPHCVTHC